MMNPHKVLVKPLITEKGISDKEKNNTYYFIVDFRAEKDDIKKSVESVFKVHVLSVRTINYAGKPKRRGKSMGYSAKFKKAYVELAPGEKIPVFEGI